MPAVAIKTPFGADVLRTFAVYGMECDPEKGCRIICYS